MAFAGCAGTTGISNAPPEDLTEQIIGGTDDIGDPAIAALFAHKPGENTGSLCTATLITPTVLITAAHCVKPSVVGDGMEFLAIFNPTLSGSPASTQHLVAETHFDPAFNETNLTNGHDVAVAILAEPITDITPIPWRRTPLPASFSGQNARLVGYGLNDGFNQTGAGTKRQVTVKIGSVTDTILQLGNFGATSCNGDSGGPALVTVDGQEQLVGVTSFGLVFCIGPGSYTNVGMWADEIVGWGGGGCSGSCSGKQCGMDGCGVSCGTCGDGTTCENDQCVPVGGGCGSGEETEPNDVYTAGSEVCQNHTILGGLKNINDVDYYVIKVPKSSKYRVTIDGIDPNLVKGYLKKWGSSSKKLLNVGYLDPDAPDSRSIAKSTTSGGTYYLKVYNFPGTAGSNLLYTVNVEIE
jgi:V8-like Glu-specific endopeptidase